MTTTKTYYFTYGSNHCDEQGRSLGSCYTPVTVEQSDLNDSNEWDCELAARHKMQAARDDKWSMCYDSQEAAGVDKYNLHERSLESVAFDRLRMKRDAIARELQEERQKALGVLALCDKAAAIMERLPDYAIRMCAIHDSRMMIYNMHEREQVQEVLHSLAAGRWEKKVNPSYSDKIDYVAVIDGVTVEIYAAPPPESCQIITEEIDVPAHKEIRRKLICAP